MAYVSAETKARIAPRLREIARKHGVKATVAVRHNSTLAHHFLGCMVNTVLLCY